MVGLVAALWAGMGAVLAAQNAMNQLWGVPFTRRPSFLQARSRALLLLVVLGGGLLATTVLAGAGTRRREYGVGWKIALDRALDAARLRGVLGRVPRADGGRRPVVEPPRRGDRRPRSATRSCSSLGGYYVGHVVANAANVYGTFALVIGLLSFIYLAVHITLLGAEVNVVAARRLWPRSLSVTVGAARHACRP